MAKRTICIQNPAKISIAHSLLRIERSKESIVEVPLDEIWVLILETAQVSISSAALSELVDAGIGTMTCGKNHMPNGLLLPIGAHSRHSAIVEKQLTMSKPLKKRLWQQIVISKITNQAAVLDLLGIDSQAVRKFAQEVGSGDTTNRESAAASTYFKLLIPKGTRRNGPYTAALDYGYAVLRAGVGREAVSGGWLVSRGIHHDNNLNAFNLVDDLIEPLRPVIDLLICTKSLIGDLTPTIKTQIAALFEILVEVDGKRVSVQHAIECELDSLRRAVISGNEKQLVLPKMIPLAFVNQE